MTGEQIRNIIAAGRFPGAKTPALLEETHISWVVLTPDYAFKIKKPVQFDFLDFGTLEKRRFYCAEELKLNRRIAPDMYLGVLPVGTEADRPAIGSASPPVIDYAVWMRRMEDESRMDLRLAEGVVTTAQLDALAAQLAHFHREATIVEPEDYRPGDYRKDFEDLYHEEKDAVRWLGPETAEHFRAWGAQLPVFLNTHAIRMRDRFERGFWVDGHGDLHTRNIFLTDPPTVFDCIEFNPHFRRLDTLNELAFLCMDLEARDRPDLAQHFMEAYCRIWEVRPTPEDALLFLFFKAYRANVRLKINLLALRQQQSAALEASVQCYWRLLKAYMGGLGIK
jgi:uncharacterized protein